MEQQTAVEWLYKEEENLFISYQKGFMSLGRYTLLKHKLFEKAKQMEKKQQIISELNGAGMAINNINKSTN